MAWTDERLDDFARRTDAGIDALRGDVKACEERLTVEVASVRAEVGALRTELGGEVRSTRGELRGEIGSLREELRGEIGACKEELRGEIGACKEELRGDMADLRAAMARLEGTVMRVCVALAVGLLGLVATVVGIVAAVALGGG